MSRLCGCWKCFKCDADLLFGVFILQSIPMKFSRVSTSGEMQNHMCAFSGAFFIKIA